MAGPYMLAKKLTLILSQPDPNPPVTLQVVGDIVVGSVLGSSGQRANECRMAAFFAGFPDSVPVQTLNRSVGCVRIDRQDIHVRRRPGDQ